MEERKPNAASIAPGRPGKSLGEAVGEEVGESFGAEEGAGEIVGGSGTHVSLSSKQNPSSQKHPVAHSVVIHTSV